MNVNIDNLEHVITSLNGFEDLRSGEFTTPDAIYAKTVLKLNGVDFKGRVGSESFLGAIKEGAVKFYEMIKNFLKGIRDFFFGSKGEQRAKVITEAVKETKENINNLDTSKPLENISEEDSLSINNRFNKALDTEQISLELEKIRTFDDKFIEKLQDPIRNAIIADGLLGLKMNDNTFKWRELIDIYKNIEKIAETEKDPSIRDVIRLVTRDKNKVIKIQELFLELRKTASDGLKNLATDTEKCNEGLKKLDDLIAKGDNNKNTQINRDFLASLCKDLVKIDNSFAELIKHCDDKIIKIKECIQKLQK